MHTMQDSFYERKCRRMVGQEEKSQVRSGNVAAFAELMEEYCRRH